MFLIYGRFTPDQCRHLFNHNTEFGREAFAILQSAERRWEDLKQYQNLYPR
jgi:hypothetical protein